MTTRTLTNAFRLLLVFFSFHPSVLFATVAGIVLACGGLLLPGGYFFPVMLGNMFILMPVIWSAGVFRQLLSNRTLMLVPRFRTAAILAYLLIPVSLGLLYGAAALLGSMPPAIALMTVLLTFTAISTYLLIAQWACTLPYGWLIQAGVVIGGIQILTRGPGIEIIMTLITDALRASALAGAALLGWCLLFRTLGRGGMPAGPTPSQRMERLSGVAGNNWPMVWQQPTFGRSVLPVRTLMRGNNDSVAAQLWMAVIQVAAFAALMMSWMLLMVVARNGMRLPDPGLLFISISFSSLAMVTPLAIGEWPARLRLAWLRTGADRAGLWNLLERALLQQTLAVVAVAAVSAALLAAAFGTEPVMLVLYVAGCGAALPFGAYLTFWCRSGAISVNVYSFAFMLLWTTLILSIWWLYRQYGVPALWPVPILIAALALLFRQLARRRFHSIDWCRVRPVRQRRGMLPAAKASS